MAVNNIKPKRQQTFVALLPFGPNGNTHIVWVAAQIATAILQKLSGF
jgi:hypothetical protein